jgi:excinuclease ABC subunit A
VLDEPTTGLHAADVAQLMKVLDRLVERGNAVVVVEHNTELLEACDRLVELGPAGGDEGGRLVAAGTPRDLAKDPASITGRFLFQRAPAVPKRKARRQRVRS